MARTKKNENSEVPETTPLEEVAREAEEGTAEALPDAEPPADTIDSAPNQSVASPDEPEKSDDGKIYLSLSLSKAMFDQSLGAINRLKYAIGAKQTLLKKALGMDSLEIVVEEERVVFPWFTLSSEDNAEEINAYSKLVFALAKKAITQKRVNPDERINPDERLGMRLYLINLGFIGDEYKSARAILMRNFSASNAVRTKHETDFHMEMPEAQVTRGPQHE